MHRDHLRNLLGQYSPQDPNEIFYKTQMLDFLERHHDCFDRSCSPGHFTGSCWLLNQDGSQVLLMHHKKLNIWVQPGGHCDGDTDVLRVAIKEAQEESGMEHITPLSETIFDIDIHQIPERPGEPAHNHYDVRFLLQLTSDEQPIQNNESNALQWFDKNESTLPKDCEETLKRMFRKWITLPQNIRGKYV